MAVLLDRGLLHRVAIYLEERDDLWERNGQTIFPLIGIDGQLVSGKAKIFLKEPPPTCNEDGIEICLDSSLDEIARMIEERKAKS